jgi:hypothetical protein
VSPACTAREYPRRGSNGERERMFVRACSVAMRQTLPYLLRVVKAAFYLPERCCESLCEASMRRDRRFDALLGIY